MALLGRIVCLRHSRVGLALWGQRALTSDASIRELLIRLEGGTVDYERNDNTGLAHIIINNPHRMNAFSGSMMVQLRDVVTDLEGWHAGRAVMVRGQSGTFCAGGDLSSVMQLLDSSKGAAMSAFMQNTLSRFARLPLLSAAFLQGHTLGGGAELAATCDFRLMDSDASIGFVQSRLGVCVGWGGGLHLVRLLGPTSALELLASGRVLSASEALAVGLATEVLSNGSVDEAERWLRLHTRGPPEAVQAAKRVILNAMRGQCQEEEILEAEREIFATIWGGPAHRRALERRTKHK